MQRNKVTFMLVFNFSCYQTYYLVKISPYVFAKDYQQPDQEWSRIRSSDHRSVVEVKILPENRSWNLIYVSFR